MADILLVADVPWVVSNVCAALSEARFNVETTADPRSVPDVLADSCADVLLIDFQVGSMGGMAVTRAVRERAATTGVDRPPIILLLDRDADGFLAGRSGAESWVRKPFSADELRAAIDGVLTEAPEAS